MARISAKETLEALKSGNPPKLAIVGSARATEGRTHFLMKLRPSTLKRLQAVALGPQYLLQEYAVLRLCEELEAQPQGMVRTLDAAMFNASPEDIAEVEAAQNRVLPGRRVNRTKKQGEAVWPTQPEEASPAPAEASERDAVGDMLAKAMEGASRPKRPNQAAMDRNERLKANAAKAAHDASKTPAPTKTKTKG